MDNDSIRNVGATTLVDIWIDGKLRSICVTRAAIEEALGLAPDQAANLTEDERCEFVRQHMAAVVRAAREWLRDGRSDASSVSIDTGQLPRRGRSGERRRADRRKGERRKENLGRPEGERRRVTRRKADRRRSPAATPAER